MPIRYLMMFIILFVVVLNISLYGNTNDIDVLSRILMHGMTIIY
jgi:hypothetical protein